MKKIKLIEDEYIIIRDLSYKDAGPLSRVLTNKKVMPYLNTDESCNFGYALDLIDKQRLLPDINDTMFAIELKSNINNISNNKFAGIIQIYSFGRNQYEIGIAILPEFQGKKIGTRSIKVAIDYIYSNDKDAIICAEVKENNMRSLKMFYLLGFKVHPKYKKYSDFSAEPVVSLYHDKYQNAPCSYKNDIKTNLSK